MTDSGSRLHFDTLRSLNPPRKLLVIDHNTDNGTLLVRSLARKFPAALIQLCKQSGLALEAIKTERIDAVIAHRTEEEDAVTLIEAIREIDAKLPIVAVSGIDRSEKVLAAGADGFLNYDEWLRIGTVVATILDQDRSAESAGR